MGWKKKEKPLTPEEAIEMAKKDLAPFWFNAEPLLAAIRIAEGASVLPLNSKFVETPWVYFFVDPTEFECERALQAIKEWHRRYSEHKVGFMVLFRAGLPFVKSAPDILKKAQIHFPATCDAEGLFSAAFGVDTWPAVVAQGGTEEIARGAGQNWAVNNEEKLQIFLRRIDPGLSLELPLQLSRSLKTQSRIDLGKKGRSLQSAGEMIRPSGKWMENDDSISTADPAASLVIKASSAFFSIVAQSEAEFQGTKIVIESMDGALGSDTSCEGSSMDETGRVLMRVQNFGLQNLFQNLPLNRRTFKLSFPDAEHVPIRIYGLRFGVNDK
jgi:hypothetical protein